MTQAQDDKYDAKRGISEGSATDAAVDVKHGLPPHMAAHAPTLALKNGKPLNARSSGPDKRTGK